MKSKISSLLLVTVLACSANASTLGEPARLSVNVDQPGHRISPLLWGIFFEDINLSADGGIYPEQVRNRNFEDSDKPDSWTAVSSDSANAELSIDRQMPLSAKNPRSLKIVIGTPVKGRAGVANDGFYGMSVVTGESYRLSFQARGEGSFKGPLTASLESAEGMVYAQESFSDLTTEWKTFTAPLTAKGTDPKARLVLSAEKPGTFWLDMVSVMPAVTWKGHGLWPASRSDGDARRAQAGLQSVPGRLLGRS